MNVPTRVGFQTPFSNITLDLLVSPNFKDLPVIIGGKMQKETYSDFQKEMNIFNKAFFEVMHKGDAAGRVFSFPIPTVNITKDFDFENENLNGLIRQYIPKNTDFSTISNRKIAKIQEDLNNRPRKRFNFESPNTIFNQKVAFITFVAR
jgi:anaerobic ribonucleoside-triphosphate reductase